MLGFPRQDYFQQQQSSYHNNKAPTDMHYTGMSLTAWG